MTKPKQTLPAVSRPRPVRLALRTDDNRAAILQYLQGGATRKMAASMVGFGYEALRRWVVDDPDLGEDMLAAESVFVAGLVDSLRAAALDPDNRRGVDAGLGLLLRHPAARRLLVDDVSEAPEVEDESPEEVMAWLSGVADLLARGQAAEVESDLPVVVPKPRVVFGEQRSVGPDPVVEGDPSDPEQGGDPQ